MWIVLTIVLLLIILVVVAAILHNIGKYNDNDTSNYLDEGKRCAQIPANDFAGELGERIAKEELQTIIKDNEYLLCNLLLSNKNGPKPQIDCVLISHKGVFCIEVKRWIGHISGNDDCEYWSQKYDDPCLETKQHRNPVKQNDKHRFALERTLNNNYSVDNIVLFVDLEDGLGIQSEYSFDISDFKRYYYGLDDVLNDFEVKAIYEQLRRYIASNEDLEKHKTDLANRYGNQS